MSLKIRVILDSEQNVFRDIQVDEKETLFVFHQYIKEAFSLKGEEMASFYLSNENWFQGSEIPMEDIFEEEGGETMRNISIGEVMSRKSSRMIYVYDFFDMWTFFCETVGVDKENLKEGKVVYSFGDAPEKAPSKDKMDFFIEDDFDEEEEKDDIFDDEFDNDYYY